MTKEIKFTISDKMFELFENSCVDHNYRKWAHELFLQGLSAAYQNENNDEVSRQIERVIARLREV